MRDRLSRTTTGDLPRSRRIGSQDPARRSSWPKASIQDLSWRAQVCQRLDTSVRKSDRRRARGTTISQCSAERAREWGRIHKGSDVGWVWGTVGLSMTQISEIKQRIVEINNDPTSELRRPTSVQIPCTIVKKNKQKNTIGLLLCDSRRDATAFLLVSKPSARWWRMRAACTARTLLNRIL